MDYRTFLTKQLQKAAETAKGYFGKVNGAVKTNDNNQVLTEADIAIGKQLVAAVQAAYPDHNVIDEEAGVVDKGSRYTWVIDPIDGTSNFAAGTPDYGIMIGLLEDATPVAGGIALPAHGKLFVAAKGKGATCNGKPIHVTEETNLLNVLVSCIFNGNQETPEITVNHCRVVADVANGIRNMRSSGSDAIDPMYVAAGSYGGVLELTSKIWDNVAPHIIAEEAGALWTAADGRPMDYASPLTKVNQNFTFCVAPPELHKQLQTIIAGRL